LFFTVFALFHRFAPLKGQLITTF
jgi:3-hydroxyacyl-CoA dehydrogenase